MIVYGQNHFKIKSFTPQELRLPKEEGLNDIDIQVRQRYAHLFWIPFFPIGKLYCFKRLGDDNLYELPEDIKRSIQYTYEQDIKTPWYSYSLIILALSIGLWYYTENKFDEAKYENRFYLEQAEKKMMIKYPTTGDSYSFKVYNNETESSYNSTSIILQVNSYDEDTIEFISNYEDLYGEDIKEFEEVDEKLEQISEQIDKPNRIKKSDLVKMIEVEYDDRYDSDKRFKMEGYDNLYFEFKSIKRKELKKS